MRIYLAGKIDPTYGAWRDAILAPVYDSELRDYRPRWLLRVPEARFDAGSYSAAPPPWPVGVGWIPGPHDYVGPYRLEIVPAPENKHSGDFHGATWWGQHGWMDDGQQRHVVQAALAGIRHADLVFAYLNTADCYGTIAEIGYAAALGKSVYIVDRDELQNAPEPLVDDGDFWFVRHLAFDDGVRLVWPRRYGEADEPTLLREHLQAAIGRWAAQVTPPVAPVLPQVAQAFRDIERWTSDPRVRGEAQKMLRSLSRAKSAP